MWSNRWLVLIKWWGHGSLVVTDPWCYVMWIMYTAAKSPHQWLSYVLSACPQDMFSGPWPWLQLPHLHCVVRSQHFPQGSIWSGSVQAQSQVTVERYLFWCHSLICIATQRNNVPWQGANKCSVMSSEQLTQEHLLAHLLCSISSRCQCGVSTHCSVVLCDRVWAPWGLTRCIQHTQRMPNKTTKEDLVCAEQTLFTDMKSCCCWLLISLYLVPNIYMGTKKQDVM